VQSNIAILQIHIVLDYHLKENKKILSLESSLKWFKNESVRLNSKNKELIKWKNQAQISEEEVKYLKGILKESKKV